MTKQKEVEQKCMRAAGFVPGKGWPLNELQRPVPKAVQIKMHYGDIVTTGWENAARSILMGVATLVEP